MSPNSQERDEVQKIILALLLSHKNSISLKELNSEYYDQEGEHIPWKKFGNISLLDFLKCMQKYVSLEKQNNVFYARGIASDKTKHVGSLVARQKLQPQKLSGNRKTYKPSHYYPKTASPRIQIPADILSNIVYTVRQHPKGISKNHILHMVQNKLPYIDITMNELEEQLRELSHEIFIKSNLLFPSQNNITQKGTGIKDIINTQENKNPDRKSQTVNEPMYCVAGDENTNSKALYINIDDDYQHLSPPSVSKSNLSEEKKTRKKQNISNFIQETVFKCQRETVEQDQTLPNEVEQQRNFEEVDSYYCNDSEKFKLQLDNIEYQERSSNIDNDFASILISDRLRFRLKKLIEAHPDGIWCAQLPEKYFETYNISLNYTELGFNSVREFISYLPDIFQYNQPLCSGDFILYDASKNEIPIEGKETVRNENIAELYNLYLNKDDAEALPAILSADTCKKLTPDSVMTIGECVGQINVVDLKYSLQPYIEVYVVEIFTPSLFWIRLRKKEKAFKNMMNALHTFYTTNSKDYMIPPVVLEKGLNCACKYNGYWHRGIIKAVKPDLQVTIMFYDYGTLKTYPPEDIHYLHRSFSNLPAQAIPCGLYNTKPCVGEQWTQGVTHVFASKASYNPLIAIIAAVDIENNSMLVTLTDTSEEEDIHINDWLVSQNLAVHGRMGNKVDLSNLMLYVEENLQCYGHERSTNSDDNYMNLIDCDPKNVPLISPQSTLSDTLLKPPGLTVPTEKMNLFDNVQKNERNIKTNPFYDENKIGDDMLLNGKKSITNPFLQDEFKYDKYANILSPHMFMQMYEKNLKIQMQIAAAINILLTKIKMLPLENTNDILSTSEQLTPKINLQGNINSNDNTVPCNTFLPKERATINNNFVDLNSNGVNWNSFSPTTNNASIHNGENIDQDNSFTHLLANEHNMNYNKVNNFDDFKVSSLCNEINNKSVLPSNNTVQKDLNLCNSISLNTTIPCNTSDAYVFNNGESDFSEVIPETILPVFNKNVINDAHQSITINEVDHQFCQFEQESKKNELNTYKETNPFKALIQDESRTFEFFDSPKKQILPEKLISSTEVINNYSKSESSNFKHPIEYVHIFENMNEQSNNIKDINESISRITFKSSSDKKKNKVEHWKEDKLFTKVADFHAFCSHKLEENENEKSMVSIPHKYTNEMLLNGTNNLGTITDSRDTFNAVNSSPWPINNSNSMVSLNSNNSILKPSSLINFDLSSVINNSNPDDKKYLLCRSISETSQTSQSFSRLFNDTDNTQLEVDKKNNSRSISAEEWLNSVKASFASETQFTQMDNPIISNSSQIKNGDQKFISLSELFKKNLDSCEQSLKNETTLQNYFLKEFKCDKSQSNHKDIDIEYKGCSNNITETGENIASYSYKIGSTLNDLKLENQENETMEQIVKIQSKIEADSEQIITHKQIPYHTVSKDITSQILFAYPVELTKKVVFVFHFEDEGWLSTEEFVNVFTNYETLLQYLETLSIHNIDVSFKEIVRSENSDIFNHIDRILSTTPRNEDKKINKIHLMPLKSIIIVLAKLRIIELEDLDNAVTKKELIQGSFIYEAWKLIRSYGILLQLIKEKLKNI